MSAQRHAGGRVAGQDAGSQFSSVTPGVPLFLQAARQLITAIETGKLTAGARLPSEQTLSGQFGVSRASMREALSCLQFLGYIESRRGSGAIVTSHPRPAALLLAAGAGSKDLPGLLNLIEARLATEPAAVALAVRCCTAPGVRQVERIINGMRLALDQPGLDASTDLAVHLAFLRMCPNPFLRHYCEHLAELSTAAPSFLRGRAWVDQNWSRSWLGHHETMLRAAQSRDSRLAESAATAHLLSVVSLLESVETMGKSTRDHMRLLRERWASSRGDVNVATIEPVARGG